jgi:hypothetical protein
MLLLQVQVMLVWVLDFTVVSRSKLSRLQGELQSLHLICDGSGAQI